MEHNSNLLVFGAGVGAGLLGLWLIAELFPLLVLGGAGYVAYQGLKQTTQENPTWQKTGQDQKSNF